MPLSVIITTFKKENVKRPLEGFGVLVPSKEQQNGLKTLGNALLQPWTCKKMMIPVALSQFLFLIIGTLFSSMMFPDRAPNDLYLYTTLVGGSRNKELAKASTYGSFTSFHLLPPFAIKFIYFLFIWKHSGTNIWPLDLEMSWGRLLFPTSSSY